MGKEAADKIKDEADKREKDLKKAKVTAENEKDTNNKKKLEEDNEEEEAYIGGLRAAEQAARDAPKGTEGAGIRAIILDEQEKCVGPLEKARKEADRKRDEKEAKRLLRQIHLQERKLAGKRKANELIL